MQLTAVHLKNFRCFDDKTIHLTSNVVVIEGLNGSGKTTLLEALHYLCYLRSFRTHLPRDLLNFGEDTFFVKALFNERAGQASHEIQVGFSGKKRLVKINQKAVSSYKELLDHYRVVTLTEDDLDLIKGGPDVRRTFVDQLIALYDPSYMQTIRVFKKVVENRNMMLVGSRVGRDSYELWTTQLLEKTREIQDLRCRALDELATAVNAMLAQYVDKELRVSFDYVPKRVAQHVLLETLLGQESALYQDECRYRRSLFGAHLDDFVITLRDKRSKRFASRGQQKLIVMLIKIAQIRQLNEKKGPAIFLLDDFMTDFDSDRARQLIKTLADLDNQLIFTSPVSNDSFDELFDTPVQHVKLTG